MKKQKIFGIVLLIYSILSAIYWVWTLIPDGIENLLSISLAADVLLLVLAIMMIGKRSINTLMKTISVAILTAAVYYSYMTYYCFTLPHTADIASEYDNHLPGFGMTLKSLMDIIGCVYLISAIVVILTSVLGFLLASGKKCGTACIVFGALMIVAQLIHFGGLPVVILAVIYIVLSTLLKKKNKCDSMPLEEKEQP